MIGKSIAHYKILEKIGSGGMGVIYKAVDIKLKRTVALKFLPPALSSDQDAKSRFIQEAQAASALDHPNICTIHEIGETDDGQSYIAMACYDGQSLRDYYTDAGVLGTHRDAPEHIDEIISITIQIAKGLARAHEKGIVHRDIKPANIMITKRGEVKILDFGLAKLTGQARMTRTGTTVGTVAYMSPEQARGDDIDQRTDIWSLGVILYEMLSGKLPFRGEFEQAIIYSIMNEDPESLELTDDIPQELLAIVKKLLTKDINDRYHSIEELLQDFQPLSSEAVIIREESFSHFIIRAFRKNRVRYLSLSFAAILVIALILILIKPFFFKDFLYATAPPIAVISFENKTGDKDNDILARMIPTLLITKLEQSGGLRVSSWERLFDLKKKIGKDSIDFIDLELGIQLCRMDGVEMIVTGTLMKAGDLFATDVKVLDVNSKNILKSVSVSGQGEESILKNQVDELGKEISLGVGLSESNIQVMQKPVMDFTTTSTEAYKYYVQGRELNLKWKYSEAKPFYELAIVHDSTFASAYYGLGQICRSLNLNKQAEVSIQKAMIYSKNTSERERLLIQSQYYRQKNPTIADSLYKVYLEKYGTKRQYHKYMASQYRHNNKYDKAVEEYNRLIDLDPEDASLYNTLGYIYLDQNDFDKALQTFRKYAELAEENDKANAYDCIGDVYMKMGEMGSMIEAFKEVYRIDPNNPWATARLALSYAWKEEYGQAIEWSMHYNNQHRPDIPLFDKGLYNFLAGRRKQSIIDLDMALHLADSIYKAGEWPGTLWNAKYLKSWIYYELDQSEKGRDELRSYFKYNPVDDEIWIDKLRKYKFEAMVYIKSSHLRPARQHLKSIYLMYQDTVYSDLQRYFISFYHDLIKTEILLAEDSTETALILAKQIKFSDFALFNGDRIFLSLFPFQYDLPARALLKLDKLDEAIAEYERLTSNDPNIRGWHLIPARYHFILGKLYEQKSWPGKAIEKYKHFLEVWKNADRDIPELNEAKERLKALDQA